MHFEIRDHTAEFGHFRGNLRPEFLRSNMGAYLRDEPYGESMRLAVWEAVAKLVMLLPCPSGAPISLTHYIVRHLRRQPIYSWSLRLPKLRQYLAMQLDHFLRARFSHGGHPGVWILDADEDQRR
jgi:hypothetical protein